jgi:hypothetical protein
MNAQGTLSLNTAYFSNLTNAIGAAGSRAELQALVTEAFGSLAAVQGAITSELASVEPLLALLTPPGANPTAIVTWLTAFITAYLTPLVKPAVIYALQLTELATQVAALTAVITSAEAQFASCSISVPSL